MARIYTVYEGEYSSRRTVKFRQVDESIQELIDHGVSEKEIGPGSTANHEKAHILGHNPGRTGRITARVLVNKYNLIEGWWIEHDIEPKEKLSMSGKEMIRGCLAPMFVKNRNVSPLNIVDIASAAAGGLVVGLETVIDVRKAIRHKLHLLP